MLSGLREGEGLGEATVALEMVAVLAVAGRVLGAGQQQAVAVGGLAAAVVLQQAEPELLIVRVIADDDGAVGQRPQQRCPVEAGLEVDGSRSPVSFW